ncbi:thioredoxin [Pyrococcus furiosus DSM 3638]|uniref:Thioredoxin n=3 Tax=Pyrococcus furiosus TaxID=2261 RepID=A0A5C0XQK9_PYRFU|nr:thioredoxin family protein [Pyrococcus furiosus]AFN03973.1 hypothetical protein PFC_05130 [Pyrococcus furiosus COM1]QEK78835.1 thioredoxin [Pyrococcus furiosus DSM 3638]
MRGGKIIFALLMIMVVISAGCTEKSTPTTTPGGLDKSKFHFYIYGVPTCPHCQKMKEVLPEYYGEGSTTFYDIGASQHNYNIYMNFSKLLGVRGVPLIGIFYNNTLYGVVEGEFPPEAAQEIVEKAIENNGVIILISSGTYLLPRNETKAIEAIENMTKWFLNGEVVGQ